MSYPNRPSIVITSACLLFLLICFPPPTESAQAADEAAVRKLIERFFIAYQKRDVETLTSLWSRQIPAEESSQKGLQRVLADAEKLEIKSYRLRNLTVESDRAEAEIVAEAAALGAQPKPDAPPAEINRTLRLVKRNNEWKIWLYVPSEEELAAELVRAGTEAERQSLLSRKRDFVTPGLVQALLDEGDKLQDKERLADALSLFRLSLTIAEQLGEKELAATALRQIGNVHYFQDDYAQALDYYQRSLKLSEEAGNKQDIAGGSMNIGTINALRGNYVQALDYFQKALKMAEELGNKQLIASAFNSVGNIYKAQGAYAQALESYQKSLKLAEETRHTLLIGHLLNNIGNVYQSQRNAVQALEYHGKSLKLAEESGNKRGVLNSLVNIGGVYYSQGNFPQALEYYGKGMKLAEELGSKDSIARLLGNTGIVYQLTGNYTQALEYQQKALKLGEELGSKELLAGSFNNIGDVYASQRKFDEGLNYYLKSLKIAEEMGNREFLIQALNNIGGTYIMLNRPQLALEYGMRSAVIASEVGLPDSLWKALMTQGRAQRMLERPDAAKQSFLKAISNIEQLREQVAGGEQAQQRFFEDKVSPYYAMVDLLFQEKDFAQALNYAERAKGRVLLDVLSSGRVNITKAMTGSELEQDRLLMAEIATLNAQILQLKLRGKPDPEELARLNQRLESARLAYESFQVRLYAMHPELKVQRGEARVLALAEVDALLPDAKTALLEYVVMEERTYLFVITRGAKPNQASQPLPVLRIYSIDINSKELAELTEDFRLRVAERNLSVKQPSQRLYDLLIRPAESQLRGVTKLCIVPDGPLWNVPFQALHEGRRGYLLEQYAIFYAPSLSVLSEMEKRAERLRAEDRVSAPTGARTGAGGPTGGQKFVPELLALGNPSLNNAVASKAQVLRGDEALLPLPDAEREVNTLGHLYGPARSRILIAGQALERTVKSEAQKYSILHFATHSILDDSNPMYSRVVLASETGDEKEDGLLEAWEMMNLDLKADLVVLSACQTARGRVGAGEGVIGIAWAVFVAGSPTVVVSQWRVDSARTTDLMIDFHQNLLKRGTADASAMTKAEALRQAALKMLRGKYNHPAYWAGFVLIGADR
jgi:CHAT domain-containing protein/tetratricopeptide (TPR) repeat protein